MCRPHLPRPTLQLKRQLQHSLRQQGRHNGPNTSLHRYMEVGRSSHPKSRKLKQSRKPPCSQCHKGAAYRLWGNRNAGIPVNLATARRLAKDRPFDFEKWAITRIPGLAPNDQQVADGGVDGRGHLVNAPDNHDSTLVLAQVKGGAPSVDQVKAFAKEIEDQEAAAGIFITLEPFSSPTADRVASGMADLKIGAMDYPRLQFWSIDLHFDNRPAKVPPMVNPLTGKEDSRQLQVL